MRCRSASGRRGIWRNVVVGLEEHHKGKGKVRGHSNNHIHNHKRPSKSSRDHHQHSSREEEEVDEVVVPLELSLLPGHGAILNNNNNNHHHKHKEEEATNNNATAAAAVVVVPPSLVAIPVSNNIKDPHNRVVVVVVVLLLPTLASLSGLFLNDTLNDISRNLNWDKDWHKHNRCCRRTNTSHVSPTNRRGINGCCCRRSIPTRTS